MIYLVSPNDDRNYGAVLQATALQSFLTNLGYKSQFIRLKKNLNSVLDIDLHSMKGLIKSVFVALHRRELAKSCALFDAFVRDYQHCTSLFENYEALVSVAPKGEAYIVGSDQIWPETNLLPLNMLSFVPCGTKKLSYAASMGKEYISESKKEEYRRFLADFAAVSIREESSLPAMHEVYDQEVFCHIDPTLLYDASHWEKKEKKYQGKLPDQYILLYLIYTPKDINQKLKRLKDKTHLPIVMVSNTPYKNVECDLYIRDAGPAEFLWLVHHAEGVVASSFHGCVFSIIYRKPLIAVNNPAKPARLKNLLSMLHMEACLEWNDNFLTEQPYDHGHVEKTLLMEKERSAGYLRSHLGNENNRE